MNKAPAVAEGEKDTAALSGYLRTTNYLAAAQIYLQDNVLLRERLRPEHIKDRLLGHWGTCPGINLVYYRLNQLILREGVDAMLVIGPGHGAPANLANLYLEGTLHDFYPELTFDAEGLRKFVRAFSWPGGVHRLRAEIGQMLAAIRGRPDAIIFTGAIGETEPAIRAAACEVFAFLGLQIDPEANAASRVDSDIATINSSIRVFVIKAEENWQIARECAELLRQP